MSCLHGNPVGDCDICDEVDAAFEAGLKAAAVREWIGLTDEERMDCIFATKWSKQPLMDTAKLIEAKLREKNA